MLKEQRVSLCNNFNTCKVDDRRVAAYRWNGSGWDRVAGQAEQISVGPDGKPWVVTGGHQIYRLK